jgi:LacI family transcriptional regulator
MAASTISTRRSIALEAGLSPTTVSLVLNNRGDSVGIKAETQQRVREIARRHNYVPNPLARGLLGKSTKTVGLLWGLGGPHLSAEMAQDISLRMQKRGYITHLTNSLTDPEIVRRQLADYRQRCVDAVVIKQGSEGLLTQDVCRQLSTFKAAVTVSAVPPALPMDWICHDMVHGYIQAADHLADTGRRRPAIFTNVHANNRKVEGFLGQCRQRGMEVSDKSVINLRQGGQLKELADEAAQSLKAAFPGEFPFDCLVCSADEVAAAAMVWLRGKGLRAPEDVGVIGCNNGLFCNLLTPALASMERQDEKVAEAIEQLIVSRLARPDLEARRMDVCSRFVWRESAGGTAGKSGGAIN